jgi:exopolyphosphatase/guanosine-5'-triphosphate,3'-diphosphate pyrophosphatase
MREIDRISTRLDLGLDVYKTKRISTEKIEELCQVLRDFKRIMDGYRVDDCQVCATSAFRESRNMVVMLDYIEKQTGFQIEVLSNSEQRFLDYKSIASVTSEFETIIQGATAIVDLGGSSMQISLFDKDKLITTQNIRIGTVSTREKLLPCEKNRAHFIQMASELLNHELAGFNKLYQKDRQIRNLIVVGGNLRELMKKYERADKEIISVSAAQFGEISARVVTMTPEEISAGFDISPEDTSVIVPSAIYCSCMIETFGVETMWFPGFSLSDGIAYDYGEKKKLIKSSHSFEEDIIAAARSASKRYKCSQAHVRNLESIALAVFDRMKKVQGLTHRDRLLLQIAVILHNCGKYISLENVSECAYNIIMATEIIGLSHTEREMIAYTVKFNTSPFPDYEDFDMEAGPDIYMRVAKLTAILRLVNALDRTHRQKCTDVTVVLKEEELRITAATRQDLTLEAETFAEKAQFFEEVFHVRPVFRQKKNI